MEVWKTTFFICYVLIFELSLVLSSIVTSFEGHLTGFQCIVAKAFQLKIFPGNMQDNKSGNMCTKVFVSSRYNVDETLSVAQPLSVILLFNNLTIWNIEFFDYFHPKYLPPCSIVIYGNVNVRTVSKNWISYLPGSNDKSIHLVFFQSRDSFLNVKDDVSPFLKSRLHLLFIFPSEPNDYHLESFDVTSNRTVEVGVMHENLPRRDCCLNLHSVLDYSRWNMNGARLLVAMSQGLQAPSQQDFDNRRFNENPRDYLLFAEASFKLLVLITSFFVEEGVNGTVAVAPFNTTLLGGYDSVERKWVGLFKEVMVGNAHTCIGLAATQEGARVVTQANAFLFDDISFITGLPRQSSGSIFFLFESFQPNIWLLLVSSGALITGILARVNRVSFPSTLSLIIKPLLDQSVNASVEIYKKHISHSCGSRILLGAWLLSIIVIGLMYKSRLTSVLIEPVVIQPPKTMWELARSQYKIGTLFYREMEFGSVVERMRNLELVQRIERNFVHYNLAMKEKVPSRAYLWD